jgi:hypothetical protein
MTTSLVPTARTKESLFYRSIMIPYCIDIVVQYSFDRLPEMEKYTPVQYLLVWNRRQFDILFFEGGK